jgi:hypothetical protein
MLGVRFRSFHAWRHLSLFSLLASAAALCLLVVLASSLDSRVLTGLWQRLLLAVLFIWCAIVLKRFDIRLVESRRLTVACSRREKPRAADAGR